MNLAIDCVFNNQTAGAAGAFGVGWTSSYGPDVKLVFFSDHVDFHDPTGYVATYTKSGSSFITPPGMDADLTLSGSTYTLTFHVSNVLTCSARARTSVARVRRSSTARCA